MMTRTHKTLNRVARFTNYAMAESFRNRADDTMLILQLEVGQYAVATGREARILSTAGYEIVA